MTIRPDGYPDDEPIVPHGMAVSLTAPEAFRFTFDALQRAPARARLLDPDGPRTVRIPADALATLMRDVGLPNGLAEVGYDEATSTTWSPAHSSSSGCSPPLRRPPRRRISQRSSARSMELW